MKNITTYYSGRKNVFVWLAVLTSMVSLVTGIIAFGDAGYEGFGVVVVHLLFPIAANLCISVRLPLRCGDMYYVTVGPVVLLAIHFFVRIAELEVSGAMIICCLLLCVIQALAFGFTYAGRLNSKLPALVVWLFPLLFLLDPVFPRCLRYVFGFLPCMVIADIAAWAAVVFIICASKKMADPASGEPRRRAIGDRYDGRRVRTAPVMATLLAHFLPTRAGSMNYITDSIEISNLERYIREKRRSGYKHFGITHMFLAAYVRAVAEYPALNRFIAGNTIYHRNDIVCSMVIKKEMSKDSPDTTIKVHLDPSDTAAEVYEKYDALVQKNKETAELSSDYDKAAAMFNKIPGIILTLVIWVLRILDYFGMLLPELMEVSPFHASMFITSMGSLGIPPIYHHLYDFGTIPQFCAFGSKRTVREIDAKGEVQTKKYVDFTWVTDERICDGFYYAAVLKRMKQLMTHPEILDNPPEEVMEDIE